MYEYKNTLGCLNPDGWQQCPYLKRVKEALDPFAAAKEVEAGLLLPSWNLVASSSSSMSSSSAASTPPHPSAAKKGFLHRIVPLLLAANLGIGVYVLTRTSMRQPADKDEEVPSSPVVSTGTPAPEKKSSAEPPSTPIEVLPPIPENEQRRLFKWILEEKRKVKPRDPAEKKKIGEEKALLKQFIHAKSIPTL